MVCRVKYIPRTIHLTYVKGQLYRRRDPRPNGPPRQHSKYGFHAGGEPDADHPLQTCPSLLTSITESLPSPIPLSSALVLSRPRRLVKRKYTPENHNEMATCLTTMAVGSQIHVKTSKIAVSRSSQQLYPCMRICQMRRISRTFPRRYEHTHFTKKTRLQIDRSPVTSS